MTSMTSPIVYNQDLRKEIGDFLLGKCKHHIPLKVSHHETSSKFQFTLFHKKGMKTLKLNLHVNEDGEVYGLDSMNPTLTHPIISQQQLSKNQFLRIVKTFKLVKHYLKRYVESMRTSTLPDIFYVFNDTGLRDLEVTMTQVHHSREHDVFNLFDEFILTIDNPDGAIYFYIDF